MPQLILFHFIILKVCKNSVICGYTSFNPTNPKHKICSNHPRIRLVDVLPKESERQRQLQKQHEELEREQELHRWVGWSSRTEPLINSEQCYAVRDIRSIGKQSRRTTGRLGSTGLQAMPSEGLWSTCGTAGTLELIHRRYHRRAASLSVMTTGRA